jgi:hypothetical protein
MTMLDRALKLTSGPVGYCERPAGGLRFDLPAALLALWMMLGMFLDGFAHHNLPESRETFFTPWHGLLYSGFLALAGFILFHQFRNMVNGRGVVEHPHVGRRAIPGRERWSANEPGRRVVEQ